MKIGLSGTSCSGKTTLFNELRKRYPEYSTISEIASDYTEEQRNVFTFQQEIMSKQIYYERELGNMISDRTVFDNLAYCLWYYKRDKYRGIDTLHDCYKRFNSHIITMPYDAIVFVDEYFPLENNGIRTMDSKQQSWIYEKIEKILSVYQNVYDLNIIYVKGSTEERIKTIEKHISLS